MTDVEQREAARQFVNKWNNRGNEEEDARSYWLDFLGNVMGITHPTDYINFEKKVVVDGNTKKIDAYIPETKVLIEQKSLGIGLDKKLHNSGGIELTPYEQAKRYNDNLPYEEKARWIIISNFTEIWIYDMNVQVPKPNKIMLVELQGKYPMLDFMVKKEVKQLSHEMEISLKAGDIVGLLYNAFMKQYKNPENPETLKSLNVLCVRLVFCLYAEDAGIFGRRNMFHDYLANYDTHHLRSALIDLFKVLDQRVEDRDPYLIPELAEFPYVNGGLFANENIEIPMFTDEIRELILVKASEEFDWSAISPTIFGAVFESTLNPETRRTGGMHYTSIENIHKVIDPLFLDELKKELEEIKENTVIKTRVKLLKDYQDKLSSLKFLDPAAGSGNFLTETYISIRRLENEVIRTLQSGQMMIGEAVNPIKVSINQFYGIEINDFAVTVAKTALWIAESQMMKETENIMLINLDFLPLKTNANIVEANALRIDWNDVIPAEELNYIMGNPPFVGKKEQTRLQKDEVFEIFEGRKGVGILDYVTCWYMKSIKYITNTTIRCAFVSTNSITQGEQAPVLWSNLKNYGICIIFARRTFVWDSEADVKAHVHCVIIGFTCFNIQEKKKIFDLESEKEAIEINPYLIDAPFTLVLARTEPLQFVPKMIYGSMPIDNGYFTLEKEDVDIIVRENKNCDKYIREYVGGAEIIKNQKRWCLWLLNANPTELKKSPFILNRIEQVRTFRLSSSRPQTLKAAETPTLFGEIRQPDSDMLVFPKVSSEKRRYLPISFVGKNTIVSGSALLIPDAKLYIFGILISNIHNAWMRMVAGRMKSDYQYSASNVYNTFPWPEPSDEQKRKIEQTAQGILDARKLYPNSSLADLYDPLLMPAELRKAHTENDRAVMKAYGFDIKLSEADCVAELMKMYQKLVEKK